MWLALISIATTSAFGQKGDIHVTTSPDILPWPISVSVKTEFLPAKAGQAAFRLTVSPTEHIREGCDTVVISVKNLRGMPYTGPESWVVPASELTPYTYTVNIAIPDNDTSAIEIGAGCTMTMDEARWFVTTGDTLEMYAQNPIGVGGRYKPSWSDLERAKFTPVQLQKEFEFVLDLRHCFRNQRVFVEKLLEDLEPTDTPNVYMVRTSVDNYITLWGDWGVHIVPANKAVFDAAYPQSSPPPHSRAR